MDEQEILAQIREYVNEEHELRERHQRNGLSQEEEGRRLERLEAALDQCWDLLRQRRARLEFREDPDEAAARPPGEVEGYWQ